MTSQILFIIVGFSIFSFFYGQNRIKALTTNNDANSLPHFYGLHLGIWCLIPTIALVAIWYLTSPFLREAFLLAEIQPYMTDLASGEKQILLGQIYDHFARENVQTGEVFLQAESALNNFDFYENLLFIFVSLSVLLGLFAYARQKINPDFRARRAVENFITVLLAICATVAIFTTFGIILSLLMEALRFFQAVSLMDFFFGLKWSPQTAIHADQSASEGAFGIIPLFSGTFLITFIAMLVAVPIGLFAAIYMSDYASPKTRATVKPLLEILAGIPTVVFGFFAALTVGPIIRYVGESLGLDVSSESALAAGLVMGIMIIPFISSLSDDVMSAVPQALRDGSYGLGATKSETIRKVVLPAAMPGIVAAVLLAISRAIGETMIVVMAAGLRANLTLNPLEDVTTVTVQIVALLTGDQEFNTPKTLSVFALGLVLFVMTLCMNLFALYIVKKYRRKYS